MSALEDARADLAAIEHKIAVDAANGLLPNLATLQHYEHRKAKVEHLKKWDDTMITQLASVFES